MADFADPNLSIEELSVSELEVVVRQDTAVVTGFTHLEGHEGDKSLSGDYRFTRTWRFSEGGWRVVAVQTYHIDS
jgi:ketosteroid isomerase-like protein